MNIIEALDDPSLLGSAIREPATFAAWRTLLKGLFGLPMDSGEQELFGRCTGLSEPPTAAFGILWLVCGRRGGKSFTMALIAVFMAVFKDWRRFLSPGERAVVLIVAADREQAKVIRRYVGGILENRMFAPHVEGETSDSIEIKGNVVIEVATCSYRTVRGRSVCVALLDEVAYWRSDSSVNPDKEVWRAIRASMAQFGDHGVAIIASSPYAKKGLLHEGYKKHFGRPNPRNLVWQAATKVMNPTISDAFLAEEEADDPASFDAEYNANFRSDLETFIAREVVDAAVAPGRHEIPPLPGVRYVAFTDPSGGSADSMTLAVAHLDKDGRSILDAIRVRKPPFSPDGVVSDFADLLKSYGLRKVTGDRYAGEWPRERFRVHGIEYALSDRPASDIYRDTLPLLNSGKVELLDHPGLIAELCNLERRTARGGKDSISHPTRGHDDIAVAACGAILAVGGGSRRMIVFGPEAIARFFPKTKSTEYSLQP